MSFFEKFKNSELKPYEVTIKPDGSIHCGCPSSVAKGKCIRRCHKVEMKLNRPCVDCDEQAFIRLTLALSKTIHSDPLIKSNLSFPLQFKIQKFKRKIWWLSPRIKSLVFPLAGS